MKLLHNTPQQSLPDMLGHRRQNDSDVSECDCMQKRAIDHNVSWLAFGICSMETKQLGFSNSGWQQRLPLVALRSRPAILQSWAPACGGVVPRLRCVPFAAVRQLSPLDFVTALVRDLKASGVVVGCNYRFGHKVGETIRQSKYCCSIFMPLSVCQRFSTFINCIWISNAIYRLCLRMDVQVLA